MSRTGRDSSRPAAVGRQRPTLVFLLAFGLALLPRLLFFLEWRGAAPINLPVVDAATYDSEARAWLAGTWPGADPFWQAPLWSFVLGTVYRLFGWHWEAAWLLQAFLGAGSAVLVYALARPRMEERWAKLALALVAFNGPLIYFEGQLLRETLAIFLLLLWAWWEDRPRVRPMVDGFVSGLLLAGASLCRENALPLALVAAATRLLPRFAPVGSHPRDRRLSLAALGFGLALGLLPVTAHNLRAAHSWVPISTSGGINLYLANNPKADETLAIRPGRDWDALTALPAREAGLFLPAEQSRYFYRQAVHYIATDPLGFLRGLLAKSCDLFAAREIKRNLDLYEAREGSRLLSLLLWRLGDFGFPFGLLFPLAVVGLAWRARGDRLLLMAAVYALGVILFFPSARHRLPLVPFLILFAAHGAAEFWDRIRGAHRTHALTRLTLAFSAALTLSVLSGSWFVGRARTVDQPAEPPYLRGTTLAALGRDPEAITQLRRAVELDPRHEEAWSDLAVLHGRNGDLPRALDAAHRAIAADSSFAEAWADLAASHAAAGDTLQAERAYRRALTLSPDLEPALVGLSYLWIRQGREAEALGLAATFAQRAPRSAELTLLHANLLDRASRPAEALAVLERGTHYRADNPDLWNNLGIARARAGNLSDAEIAFRRALSLAPGHASAKRNLERLEGQRK